MWAVYALLCAVAVVYGRVFGNDKMRAMVSSWGLALTQTFVVEEPMLIFLSYLLPRLMDALSANEWVAGMVNAVVSSGVGQAVSTVWIAIRGG